MVINFSLLNLKVDILSIVLLENFLNSIFGVIPFGISFLLMIKFYLILPSSKVNIYCNIKDILKIILNSLKNGRG